MKHRKFRKLYALLTRQEKKKFRRYLLCEFGNPEHKVIKIFDQVKDRKNEKQIWEAIYPRKKYDDGAFRKMMWELNRHLTNFFAIMHMRGDVNLRDLSMMKEVGKRGNSENCGEIAPR